MMMMFLFGRYGEESQSCCCWWPHDGMADWAKFQASMRVEREDGSIKVMIVDH